MLARAKPMTLFGGSFSCPSNAMFSCMFPARPPIITAFQADFVYTQ
jgi:hypothetical protein